MKYDALQDRTDEKAQLLAAFTEIAAATAPERPQPKAIFISSDPGLGKTTLIEAVSEKANLDCISVEPRIPTHGGLYSPGFYFGKVFEAFKAHYSNYKFAPRSNLSPNIGVGFALPPAVTFNAGIGGTYINPSEERRQQLESMVDFCNQQWLHPIFHFADCTFIDCESFELVLNLVDRIEGAYCIFEYSTPRAVDGSEVVAFKQKIAKSIGMGKMIHLDALPFEDAIVVISREINVESLPIGNLRAFYEKSKGHIILFRELCEGFETNDGASPQFSSAECRYVLALIALAQHKVTPNDLIEISSSSWSPFFNLGSVESICRELEEQGKIIRTNEGLMSLSPFEDVTSLLTTPEAHVAYGAYIQHIRQDAPLKSLPAQQLLDLLNAQCRFLDRAFLETLEMVRPVICASELSDSFYELAIDTVRRMIEQDGIESLNVKRAILSFFSIFYTAADYGHANGFLVALNIDGYFPLCRFLVDTTFPDSQNMAERAIKLKQEYVHVERIVLLVHASMMGYLMRTASNEECLSYAEEVTEHSDLANYPEYWWIKKLRSHFLPQSLALEELQSASEHLHDMDSPIADRVDITYATKLARAGKSDCALKMLSAGLNRSRESFCRPGVFNNNMAACRILNGQYVETDLLLLYRAHTYPLTPFEKLYVAANTLFLCMMLDKEKETERLFVEIESGFGFDYSYDSYQRHKLTCMLCYYTWKGMLDEAARTRSALIALHESSGSNPQTIEQIWDYPSSDSSDEIRAYIQAIYQPGFIGYWQTGLGKEYVDMIIRHHSEAQS